MLAGKYLWLVFSTSLLVSAIRGTRISISPDGGYNDIVIKIQKNVPEENCRQILVGIKVRLNAEDTLKYFSRMYNTSKTPV